jgi:hypothetical protein
LGLTEQDPQLLQVLIREVMCLQYGMEEAAKHPVPAGKYPKVACVHKSVPRNINWSPRGPGALYANRGRPNGSRSRAQL